ncbi:MAG: BppU family phage baseplate upper protein [Acholeplasmatales bacterium]|nr:BppU family phage baseplate upper protein [Acholeplasmatales bacterium]
MDVIDLSNYTDRIIHETSVDFIKRIIQSSIHIMQYDNNLPLIAVKLYKNGQDYILSSTAIVKIRWRKKDGTIVYKAVLGTNETRDTVYFEVDEQMTYFDGKNTPILEVTVPIPQSEDTRMAGSGYLYFEIDRNPIQNGDIESQSEYPDLVEAVRRAEAAEATAVEAAESVSASAAQIETNKEDISDLKDEVAGIQAGQNLADIVLDLTSLHNLDVTNLRTNDKVQVLVDSAHQGASTVYNLNKSLTPDPWVYIGPYGQNTYTKSEVDTKLALKANAADVYTKIEVNQAYAQINDIKNGTIKSKTFVDTIKITSLSTKLSDINTILETVNNPNDSTMSKHVLFDVSALGASMYLCAIFIDITNNRYCIFDMMLNRIASGTYEANKLLTLAIANADQVATQSQIDSLQTQIDELGGSKVIENWDALGDLIESGDSPNHISPGDTIDVNWINTVTGTVTGTPTVTCNDKDKFISQVGEAEEATYLFVYNGSVWTYKENAITLSDWGLTVSGTPSTGAVMTINTTVKKVNYTFVGYDDMTVTGTATHNWVLEQTYAPDTKVYDSLEALFVVEAGTTIPAGSYKITQKYNDDSATTYTLYFTFASAFTAANKTQFAATGINWSSPYVPTNVAGYTYGTTTVVQSAISVSQTEISGATDISTLTGVSIHNRLIQTDLGNNNWERSNIRAWLNDDTNGTGYSPSYDFDRPSSYNLSTGFLYGIDPRVKKLIQTTVNKFQAGYGNVGYTQGQTYECNDKVFLLSMKEMGFNINTTEGNLTDLYNDYITAAGYSGLTNDAVATRSKYNQAGGSKNNYRWSRSANTWNANSSMLVNSSGSNDNYNAINGIYFAPAFTIGKKTS